MTTTPSVWQRMRPSALDWRTSVPVVVLALLVGCSALFIRLTQEYETSRVRDQQAADALWVEQTIRFQLTRDEDSLQLIAADIAHGQLSPVARDERMEQVERSRHELQRVSWLDVPPESSTASSASSAEANERLALARLALRNGRPAYSQPYELAAIGDRRPMAIDYLVPSIGGVVIGTFSLDRVLSEIIPWWFAQKNEIQLLDANGAVLASRSAGGRGKNLYTHVTLLSESTGSLYLRTDSIHDKPGIFANALAGAVVLLSAALVWSLVALRRDMARRASAEQQLRAQHAFRKAMDDSLETGVRARDLEGRTTYANRAFCKMVGFSMDELVGRMPPMPYWTPDAIEDHAHSVRRTLAGAAPRSGYETCFQRKDGTSFRVLIHEAPLIDANGEHTGWMSSVLDITERRRIEELNRLQQEKLLSGARLATLGEMASTLSHELNQPLSAINSYATGCLNMIDLDGEEALTPTAAGVRNAIEAIQQQATRAGAIVRSVHDLARRREPSRRPCELEGIVKGVLPLIELQAANRHVRVVTHIEDAPMVVVADAIMIEQVILNLARNAIEALQDVATSSRRVCISAHVQRALAGSSTSDSVVVCVADNGPGVPADALDHLFVPFYTTKPEGMGMGLAICRSAVEFHGGRIDYRPANGGGSEFCFALKRHEGRLDDVAVQPRRPSSAEHAVHARSIVLEQE